MVDYQTASHADSQLLTTPSRVLTIGAHPDDAEFGAGATLARWIDGGAHVTILVLTDGSKGSWDAEAVPDELAAQRLAEQRSAIDALGGGDLVNLGHVDGELEYSMTLRAELCSWIRRLTPDVVLTHDPWRRYMLHPDHRATGWAAIDGVVAARDHLFFPEQLGGDVQHHRPGSLLLWAADEPDHFEDAGDYLDRKVDALLCHSSQATTTMDDAGNSSSATDRFRAEIHDRAARVAVGTPYEAAETFKLIRP